MPSPSPLAPYPRANTGPKMSAVSLGMQYRTLLHARWTRRRAREPCHRNLAAEVQTTSEICHRLRWSSHSSIRRSRIASWHPSMLFTHLPTGVVGCMTNTPCSIPATWSVAWPKSRPVNASRSAVHNVRTSGCARSLGIALGHSLSAEALTHMTI